jgi:hypothetical protein
MPQVAFLHVKGSDALAHGTAGIGVGIIDPYGLADESHRGPQQALVAMPGSGARTFVTCDTVIWQECHNGARDERASSSLVVLKRAKGASPDCEY